MDSCLIVGAGLSGLVAARTLRDAGVGVTVFETEEKVGGRMRTDRLGDAVFDHGAQFFTARGDRFQEMVDEWLSQGVADVWNRGFADAEGNSNEDGYPRYMGVGGMTAIAEYLARDLDVMTGTKVHTLIPTIRGWKATSDAGEHDADAIVLSMPAPAALGMVDAGGIELPAEARKNLEGITYVACIAVMATMDGSGAVPEPGGVQIGGDPLFFVSDNHQKGISKVPALTIHAGPEFSQAHLKTEDARVTQLLLEAAKDYVGDASIRETAVYRWVHSKPDEPFEDEFIHVETPSPLVFCGDAYAGPKVEGAVMSGLAAAQRLLQKG